MESGGFEGSVRVWRSVLSRFRGYKKLTKTYKEREKPGAEGTTTLSVK